MDRPTPTPFWNEIPVDADNAFELEISEEMHDVLLDNYVSGYNMVSDSELFTLALWFMVLITIYAAIVLLMRHWKAPEGKI